MKRKQIYAVLLAGVLAAGSVPASVLAAEETPAATEAGTQEPQSQTAAGESTPAGDNIETSDDSGQTPAEQPQTSPQPSQEPAGEQSSQDNGTPAGGENGTGQVPQTQSGENQEEGTDTGEGQGDPGSDTEQDTGIAIVNTSADGTETPQYYNSLQEAVDAVATTGESSEVTVIRISKMIALQNSVDVSGKKIRITSYAADGTIVRDAGFTGDMFTVSGEGSKLQFAASEGCVLVLDGKNVEGTAGSIVNVKDGAAFGISDGVTLTGNKTTAQGGAVTCTGGNIVLEGGSITGNSGANGAVYTDKDICIQGTVTVKDNTLTDGSTAANLYLDGEAAFSVTGEMTNSTVSFTSGSPADQKTVLKAGVNEDSQQITADQFKAAAAQFAYDNADFTIEIKEDGTSAVLKQAAAATVSPTPTVTGTVTPTPTAQPGPTASPTPTPTPATDDEPDEPTTKFTASLDKTYKKSLYWKNHNTFTIKMTVTGECDWSYFFMPRKSGSLEEKQKEIQKAYKEAAHSLSMQHLGNQVGKTTSSIIIKNVPEEPQWLIVVVKSKTGTTKLLQLDYSSVKISGNVTFADKRPSVSTSTRAPKTYSVSESTVIGLEEPLQFFPNTFYEFQVVGAGQNDEQPYVNGDERWVPLYWSTSSNPTDSQKNTSFRIGSVNGITQAATYNMNVFFEKEVSNGLDWNSTGIVEYTTTQFYSAEITDDDLENWRIENNIPEDEMGYYGEDGYYAELTATAAAEFKDGESSTKSAVNTADESPLGTMSALAALSLVAGGYILVRKRKRES